MKYQVRVHLLRKSSSSSRPPVSNLIRVTGIITGASLASVSLVFFLMPHGIVVGGITGLSALLALLTEFRLALFLFFLNVIIMLLNRKKNSLSRETFTVIGLSVFSLGTLVLRPSPSLTIGPLPSALIGGALLGLGFGLALRFEAELDILKKTIERSFDGELYPQWSLLLLNCMILIGVIFQFGLMQAIYSAVAYLSFLEACKLPLQVGFLTQKVRISTKHCEDIQKEMLRYLNCSSIILKEPGKTEDGIGILECKCHTLERPRLISLVQQCDRESEIKFY
ncbi:YitT family protein [Paenibacillus sp. MB22_1]|uniref:YitT family protein n=2 Tax=Paenibacillus TaxID=44249 RepID=UPI0039A19B31